MAFNIKDVAKRAEVSPATVSLALNGSELVNKETQKRVKKIAEEMGYKPNPYAQKLVLQKSRMIGLIIPDITNVFYAVLVQHVNNAVRKAGYGLYIAMSNDSTETEKTILEEMRNNRMEGILLAPVNVPNNNPDYLHNFDIPLVFTTAGYPLIDKPCVMSDLENGMYFLTKLLIERGRKNIAYITGQSEVYTLDLREKGFLRASSDINIKIFHNDNVSYKTACCVTFEILNADKKFDAVICVNDMMAIGVVNTLLQHGIKIPEDIAVCGYDDVIFAEISPVPITTVRQDIEAIAIKSTEILFSLIKSEKINCDKNKIIKNEIIIRKSI